MKKDGPKYHQENPAFFPTAPSDGDIALIKIHWGVSKYIQNLFLSSFSTFVLNSNPPITYSDIVP